MIEKNIDSDNQLYNHPLSEIDYQNIRKDFNKFIAPHKIAINSLKKEFRIKPLLLFFALLACFGSCIYLFRNDDFLILLLLVVLPWTTVFFGFLYFFKSKALVIGLKIAITRKFKFHKIVADASCNYSDYINKLSKTSEFEYLKHLLDYRLRIRLIPFFVSSILMVWLIVTMLISPKTIEQYDYVTLYSGGLLLIISILVVIKNTIWSIIYFLFLLIATFKLIHFTNYSFTFAIGKLEIDLFALLLLIFHSIFNIKLFDNFIALIPKNEDKRRIESQLTTHFQNKFKVRSTNELQKIVLENELCPEAIKAAQNLLSLKKNNGN